MPIPLGKSFMVGELFFSSHGYRYEISGYPPYDPDIRSNWTQWIVPEHVPGVQAVWEECVRSSQAMHDCEWQFTNGRWGELYLKFWV